MAKPATRTLVCIALLAIAVIVVAFRGENEKNTPLAAAPPPTMTFRVPPLPPSFSFAGEDVPLEQPMIREQWDREVLHNYYLPNNILYILKLTGRYFPEIEERLKANGIPEDMKYLCIAESNLQQLVSKAGATGFWQFMKGSAPGFGLEVSETVDERYHIRKSTDAACKYLRQAYERFGSWTAAAASYNCGMGGFQSRATHQGTKNYYDLVLPEETNRYIFRILTFKYFVENAKQLGYEVPPEEKYEPLQTRTVLVGSSIADLNQFARSHGVTLKTLKYHNPWLRAKSLRVAPGKKYSIELPK